MILVHPTQLTTPEKLSAMVELAHRAGLVLVAGRSICQLREITHANTQHQAAARHHDEPPRAA
jgi:hypothetical protein